MAQDKTPNTPKLKVDMSILDEKTISELRDQAKKKVSAEALAAAKAQMLEALVDEERRSSGVKEPFVMVTIDLAPFSDKIMIDGKIWFQGQTVTVAESVAAVMHEMMANTWKHQSIIDGKSENFYRKSRGAHVNESGAVTSHLLRA